MVNYKIDIDASEFKELLNRLRDKMPSIIKLIVGRVASEFVNRVKLKVSGEVLRVRTGNLRNSIQFNLTGQSTAEISVGAVYGAIHEFGGVIEPLSGKKFLRFEKDGAEIFTKRVYIPARPYFYPTFNEYMESEQVRQLMVDTLREEVEKIQYEVSK